MSLCYSGVGWCVPSVVGYESVSGALKLNLRGRLNSGFSREWNARKSKRAFFVKVNESDDDFDIREMFENENNGEGLKESEVDSADDFEIEPEAEKLMKESFDKFFKEQFNYEDGDDTTDESERTNEKRGTESSGGEESEDEFEGWTKVEGLFGENSEPVMVKEDEESYTMRGADLEFLLENIEARGGDSLFDSESNEDDGGESSDGMLDIERGMSLSLEDNDESESEEESVEDLKRIGEDGEDPEYFEEVERIIKSRSGERPGVMDYFTQKNMPYMPSWLRDAYEEGDVDLITGAKRGGFNPSELRVNAPGRAEMKVEDTDKMADISGSTLIEIANDFRVPVEFVIEELAGYGVKRPIFETDVLGERALDDEVTKLSEVLTTFDAADVSETSHSHDVCYSLIGSNSVSSDFIGC